MNFNPNDPVDPIIAAKARFFIGQLPSASGLHRGYWHWAVAPYDWKGTEYNGVAFYDGRWHMALTNDPRHNALGTFDANAYAAHTYKRNGGAFGVAVAGMAGATPEDFGACPLTRAGLEYSLAMLAAFCRKYGVQANQDLGGGEHTIMTHAEAAIQDSYFPGDGDPDPRWDGERFSAAPGAPDKAQAREHGDLLRARIHVIAAAL